MLFIACIYILEVNIIQNDEHKRAFTFAMINATVKSIISGCCLLCYMYTVRCFLNVVVLTTIHVYSFPKFMEWVSDFFPQNLTLSSSHLITSVLIDWFFFFYRTWFCQMLGTTRATPTTSITLTKLGVSSLYEVGLTRPLNQVPFFWSLKSLA